MPISQLYWRPFVILLGVVATFFANPARLAAQTLIKKGPFPVRITKTGSYVLGANLNVTTSTDAIDISAANVTIDLNGFVISGSGSGTGIKASGVTETSVRNGSVTGFSPGLALGDGSVVQNVRANANQGDGIDCAGDCQISHDGANSNGNNGILVSGSNNLIADNTANGNQGAGINLSAGSQDQVTGNIANDNGTGSLCFSGIAAPFGGTPITSPVSDCQVSWNVTDDNCGNGISGGPGWQVSHNVANNNGYGGEPGSKGNGISLVGNGATIDSNVANGNGGNGLAGNPGNGYIVTNNEASNNSACGLFFNPGTGSGYSNNVLFGNSSDTGDSSGEVCGASATSLSNGTTNLCNGTKC
jgi:parallel beta-helix repeat protein